MDLFLPHLVLYSELYIMLRYLVLNCTPVKNESHDKKLRYLNQLSMPICLTCHLFNPTLVVIASPDPEQPFVT